MLQLRFRYVRQFSALSEALPSLDIQPVLSNCRTNESNPVLAAFALKCFFVVEKMSLQYFCVDLNV